MKKKLKPTKKSAKKKMAIESIDMSLENNYIVIKNPIDLQKKIKLDIKTILMVLRDGSMKINLCSEIINFYKL